MSPTHQNNENSKDYWKEQVKTHFNQMNLTADKERNLEQMLLSTLYHNENKYIKNIKQNFLQKSKGLYIKNQKTLYTHVCTAALTVVTTLVCINLLESNNHDFIAEMVSSMQNTAAMPPDFDLVGDANALTELSTESLPNQSFAPAIPKQVAQNYDAYEGRFFLFKGQQGVSISMEPNPTSVVKSQSTAQQQSRRSVLYIVKLSQKNENSFPKQKVLKRILSSSSKVKRIYAWREGAYGYAMVPQQGMTENTVSTSFVDNVFSNEEQLTPVSRN
ncbi:hypothetical protein [Silvanigrella aquatica]|uniref:Uncharacterized protein n=1 Tax=Silvanigrella aquatica TaxID=1915309 RepID=A0A1L4D2J1_9BACT|nr:hypothetical protein [Silvanigrella aquatica]APJ04425.1 hypothetical protein AXG55_11105 [Silvanigrella aquatica]